MAEAEARIWKLAHGRSLRLDRPRIIGILNVTPDSFSDGGRYDDVGRAVGRAAEMIDQGADMLDIGGESTRPGAERVSPREQITRVVPVIRAIRAAGHTVPISVDTTRASVAEAAIDAGADAVNDVAAGLEDDGMLPLVAARGAGVILMHRLVPPREDVYSHQHVTAPEYESHGGVVAAVCAFLRERVAEARRCGVGDLHMVVDPGVGFGKSVEQSFTLVTATRELAAIGPPILSAISRKSFLGAVAGVAQPSERVAATLAVSVMQALAGVSLFRVHDIQVHSHAFGVVRHMVGAAAPPEPGT